MMCCLLLVHDVPKLSDGDIEKLDCICKNCLLKTYPKKLFDHDIPIFY